MPCRKEHAATTTGPWNKLDDVCEWVWSKAATTAHMCVSVDEIDEFYCLFDTWQESIGCLATSKHHLEYEKQRSEENLVKHHQSTNQAPFSFAKSL